MPGSKCASAWRRLLPEVVIQAGGSPAVALDYSAPPPGVTRFCPGRPQPRTGENSEPSEPKPAVDGGPTLKLAALLVPRRHTPAVVGLDFQQPLGNQGNRHFHMSTISTPYGGRACPKAFVEKGASVFVNWTSPAWIADRIWVVARWRVNLFETCGGVKWREQARRPRQPSRRRKRFRLR